MSDRITHRLEGDSLSSISALAELDNPILMADATIPLGVDGGTVARAAAPEFLLPQRAADNDSDPQLAARDIVVDDGEVLEPYLEALAGFETAAGAPAPVIADAGAPPTGNGIFTPYEPPAPFVGLEAVGVLPPT